MPNPIPSLILKIIGSGESYTLQAQRPGHPPRMVEIAAPGEASGLDLIDRLTMGRNRLHLTVARMVGRAFPIPPHAYIPDSALARIYGTPGAYEALEALAHYVTRRPSEGDPTPHPAIRQTFATFLDGDSEGDYWAHIEIGGTRSPHLEASGATAWEAVEALARKIDAPE